MSRTAPVTLAPAAVRGASDVGASVDLGVCTTVDLTLALTAISGAGAGVTLAVETSADGALWSALGSLPAQTAPGATGLRLPGAGRFVRARWTLAGTAPSVTFALAGAAVLVYATPAELGRVAPPKALVDVSLADQDHALCDASDLADGSIGQAAALPLATWGRDLKRKVCDIALYLILERRGFNPGQPVPARDVYRLRYDDALTWLKEVAAGRQGLAGVADATPAENETGAYVFTSARRGW